MIIVKLMSHVGKKVEGYWDITPYNKHWDIFSCYDGKCIKNKSYECYKWCDYIAEPGARENCRMRCMDYADQMYDQLKYSNYQFNRLLPKIGDYSLLNE